MRLPRLRWILLPGLALYLAAVLWAGFALPEQLLDAPMPQRTEAERIGRRAQLCPPLGLWTQHEVFGGEGVPLELWWLHRPGSKGVAVILHGFGDDAYGTAGLLRSLPECDAVIFTFRGRDRHPEVPSTLGAWERFDAVAVVHFIEAQGIPRQRVLMVGVSQGAGVGLLALAELEKEGAPLGGALLESPYRDLADAASNHLRGTIGGLELLARPAEWIALRRAGRIAHFDPAEISPLKASRGLKTRLALLAGDADAITPLEGIQEMAARHPDFTVVHGAGHCEAGNKVPGGWSAWARPRLLAWWF
ncbi:MAG TPA: alpha/beta fold hydrolase [Holophagaceae bacterium]|nr:alpha/beta fold hydrolase [Holophagaceae bacterium]